MTNSYEETFKKIFEEYGAVICVDIPQCDPMRKEMDPELSGIRQSVWSFGEVIFERSGELRRSDERSLLMKEDSFL